MLVAKVGLDGHDRGAKVAAAVQEDVDVLDDLLVRAEYAATHAAPEAQARLLTMIRDRFRARLGVHPRVELVAEGTLPRTEFKARRVIDDRDLYRRTLAT